MNKRRRSIPLEISPGAAWPIGASIPRSPLARAGVLESAWLTNSWPRIFHARLPVGQFQRVIGDQPVAPTSVESFAGAMRLA